MTVQTNGVGVAIFNGTNGLKITPTSSGYRLLATAGSVSTLSVSTGLNPPTFAITNTSPSSCPSGPCTATFPGGGTVTAPAGTTLIIENNAVVTCPTLTDVVAGTVTVVPPSGPGTTEIKFVDPYAKIQPIVVGKVYPICKGTSGHPTGEILQSCDTHAVPCVKSQDLKVGPLDLVTVIEITSTDPPVRH